VPEVVEANVTQPCRLDRRREVVVDQVGRVEDGRDLDGTRGRLQCSSALQERLKEPPIPQSDSTRRNCCERSTRRDLLLLAS